MDRTLSEPTLPAPPGFEPLHFSGGFVVVNGPLYLRRDGAALQLGFRVEQRHCNSMGVCHGGMLATFCDMLLPISMLHKSAQIGRRFLPTIGLQVDFLAPAKLGAWVQGEAEPLRTTRSLVFGQGLVTADGGIAVRCSGVFKLGPPWGDAAPEALR